MRRAMYLCILCLLCLHTAHAFVRTTATPTPTRSRTILRAKLFDGHPTELHGWDAETQKRFMTDYWGKRPVCIRGAFSGFKCGATASQLWKIASKSAMADSRLISYSKAAGWQQQFGPLPMAMLKQMRELQENGVKWTLLVNEVNLHQPEVQTWFQAFPTIPSWKFDDIMFSYAVKGAGIGAHVDNYDVFLLQGKGSREWAIEEEFLSAAEEQARKRTDVDIHLLKRFQAQRTWELAAGDMLYLPPRIPHRGVALDDECITISFGMRNPHKDEMFGAFTSELLQRHVERELLPDAHLPSKEAMLSDLHNTVRGTIRHCIDEMTSNRALFDDWLGKYITTPTRERPDTWPVPYRSHKKRSTGSHATPEEVVQAMLDSSSTASWPQLWHAPGVKFSHNLPDSQPAVFANGEVFRVPGLAYETSVRLSQAYVISPSVLRELVRQNPEARQVVEQLVASGCLVPVLGSPKRSWDSHGALRTKC